MIITRIFFAICLVISIQGCTNDNTQFTKATISKEKMTMLSINLSSMQTEFVEGDEINVTVTAENNGNQPINIPNFNDDPANGLSFELTLPDNTTQTLMFNRMLSLGGTPPSVKTYTLNANARFWSGFSIDEQADIDQKGQYQLTAILTVDGTPHKTEPFIFSVSSRHVSLTSAATGLLIQGTAAGGELAYVQQNGNANLIYRLNFYETTHVHEIGYRARSLMYKQPESIDQIFIPENDSSVMSEMSRWIVWRNDNVISAFNDMSSQPLQWQAPFTLDHILSNVHKITNGAVQIAAVSKTNNTFWLLNANGGIGNPNPSLNVQFQTTLPVFPDEALVVVPAHGINAKQHVILFNTIAQGTQLQSATIEAEGLGKFEHITIADETLVMSIKPSAVVNIDSSITVTLITCKPIANGINLILNTVKYQQGKAPKLVEKSEIGHIKSLAALKQGILMHSKQGANERLDLVVELANGNVVKLVNNQFAPVLVLGKPTTPIQLMSAKESTYILYYADERGHYFEPL